jgi:hypothetical protein
MAGALVMGIAAIYLILTVWVAGLAAWPGTAAVFLGWRAARLGAPGWLVFVSTFLGMLGIAVLVILLFE